MSEMKLTATDIRSRLESLAKELGESDRSRIEKLLPLLDARREIPLDSALSTLFPGQPPEQAQNHFRAFRQRLRQAAGEAGVAFGLEVDSRKRTSPENRRAWFAGESLGKQEAERFSAEETRPRGDEIRILQDAVTLTEIELRDGKPLIRYFVSYAHQNAKLRKDLLERLQSRLRIAKEYAFEAWQDGDILIGEQWRDQIQQAIVKCHFGLLLVSPEFLGSKFITEKELPHFLPSEKTPMAWRRAAPVGLKPIAFDGSMDLKGLEALQIFRDQEERFFSERATNNPKDAFADRLFQAILKMVRKHIAPSPPEPPPAAHDRTARRLLEQMSEGVCGEDQGLRNWVPTKGRSTHLDKLDSDRPHATDTDATQERIDALQFLQDWATNPKAPPFCALLGEYGMGKTTTCKALTQRLLEARRDNPALPMSIYLDLRHVGEYAKESPGLESIIERIIRASWHGGHEQSLPATEVVRLVQREGALVIFDGLDEVLVHLTNHVGQQFTRELWRILPPTLFAGEASEGSRPGKLLISCRTHYFRTLREQTTHFVGEGREGIRAQDYRALLLLPFDERQIKEYLARNLPGQDLDRLLDLIRSIHNLPEMAERPYTLSLIAENLHRLEQWRMEGRKVSGATLYRHMILSWLERDAGKHQLTADHKQLLMERIAADLWRGGARTWSVADLEQWLIDFLGEQPRIAAHYAGIHRDLLKEDLRTATFLVREGEDRFRFAHTSLHEFFLAAHLVRALREGRADALALPMPSPETLDFLGQLLVEADDVETALATLRTIRASYRPQASELALRYGLLAGQRGYPAPALAGFDLEGADLRGWRFEGDPAQPLLNLDGARFQRARLDNAVLRHVSLERADFSHATLSGAELIDDRAEAARFTDADLTGTVFRDVRLGRADFAGVRRYRTQWLRCDLRGTQGVEPGLPGSLLALCRPESIQGTLPLSRPAPRAAALTGHGGWVWGCAWSPDGGRLASAGADRAVRVWDAASGECLRVLEGHGGGVWGCAWSPDGGRLASAGDDRAVRVWDAASGECLRVLEGHGGGVWGCAWSPDGGRLASAGDDRAVRVWDAASGECLRVLEGHGGGVRGCAWSPDGGRLASAGDDRAVRVWDAASGECLRVLEGHGGGVWGCAWSPDGGRLASAGDDRAVRVWDAASGECLRVLEGHGGGVWGCAWSPDGGRLASAGDDRAVRVWDAASGECLRVLEGHGGGVWGCAWSPDGGRLASAGDDRAVRVWDAASGECLRVLEGHGGGVWGCAWSPDGGRLASAGADRAVRVWDAASGECLRVLEGHGGGVWGCAWSPDGGRLASAGADRAVRVWDAASGECLRVLEGHGGGVWGCAWSPDGGRLASAGDDRAVRVWDAASGECLRVLEGHGGGVWGCAWSPDGGRLASAGDDRAVRVWDAASGECLRVLEGHGGGVRGCAWSPDGGRLASAGADRAVRVWDAASGECLRVLEGHGGGVWGCAWSPDGGRLASAGDDRAVRVWDAASGECLRVLEGHGGGVRGCAWSPDGGRLASAGADRAVRVWDADGGQERAFRCHHFGGGECATLNTDGSAIHYASPEAWRWLGWLAADPASGEITRYPAETFGPIPVPRSHAQPKGNRSDPSRPAR